MGDGEAGEVGELIHQRLQPLHFLRDQGSALADQFAAPRILGRSAFRRPVEIAPDAVGGTLDGGERVLDLMRHPLGHLLPGGDLLRLEQVGQIVQHQDVPFAATPTLQRRDAGGYVRDAVLNPELHLRRRKPGPPRLLEKTLAFSGGILAEYRREPRAFHLFSRQEQAGLVICLQDFPLRVQCDDAGGYAVEDGLNPLATLIELLHRSLQVVQALPQAPGHVIEGIHQHPQFVPRRYHHAMVKVSLRYFLGRHRQRLDRNRHFAGEPQGSPGRSQQHQHGNQQQNQERLPAVGLALALERFVGRRLFVHLDQQRRHRVRQLHRRHHRPQRLAGGRLYAHPRQAEIVLVDLQ